MNTIFCYMIKVMYYVKLTYSYIFMSDLGQNLSVPLYKNGKN